MNPTTESVTAAGILNNHVPVRPGNAMNNIGTGDHYAGLEANDPAKDSREKKIVERVESFLGPNYNLRKHMMERTQFPERSIMSLEDAFGHYTNSDHNYLTAMIFDNLRGSVNWPITQALLPLRFLANGASIRSYTFVRHIFNTALMEEVPTYVAPQIVTRRAESHTMNLGRLALGFNLEHDFMTTDEGARTYEMHLQQLSHALESSIHLRAVRTLVDTAGTRQRINNPIAKMTPALNGVPNERKFDSVHDLVSHVVNYEVPMFGAVHKRHGLDLVNKTVLPEMRREGVDPNALLVPEHAINIAMFSPEVQSYRFTGLTASGTPYTDALDRTVASVDGMKVYKYRPFRVDSIGDEVVDPLYHLTYSGEYYNIFIPPKHKQKLELYLGEEGPNFGNAPDDDMIKASELCIKVYDEKKDTCRIIKYWDAVESALHLIGSDVFQRELEKGFAKARGIGNVDAVSFRAQQDIIAAFGREDTIGDARDAALAIYQAAGTPDVVKRLYFIMEKAFADDGTLDIAALVARMTANIIPVNNLAQIPLGRPLLDQIKLHKENDVPLPCQMLIFRPNIVHRMGSAIMMKAGVETGETLVGYRSLTLSDDGDAGVHKGNFHCWTGSYVKEPKNVLHIPDIIFGGYVGGNSNSLLSKSDGKYDVQVGTRDEDSDTGDNIVIIQPLDKRIEDYHLVLPLSGEYKEFINGPDEDPWGKATLFANGLPKAMKVNNSDLSCLQTHLSNQLLVKGGQYNYNKDTKGWEKCMSRAHCGESEGGVRIVREGRMHYGSTDKTNVAIRGHD